MTTSKAIIPGDTIPWELLKQAVNINSKAGLIPRETTFEQAMVCAALGHQLGIPRFEALRGIVVVDGKPTLMAGLLSAVVTRALPSLQVELLKYGRDECIVRGRRDESHAWTEICFDWEDAKLPGLTGKRNWQSYPKAMLYARASTILLRMLGSDIVHGLYTPDEFGAVEDPETGNVTATVDPTSSAGASRSPAPSSPATESPSSREEAVEVPFAEGPLTPKEGRDLNEAEALAARISGASDQGWQKSSPSPTDTSDSPAGSASQTTPPAERSDASRPASTPAEEATPTQETKAKRLNRLGKAMKAEGICKTQIAAIKFFERILMEHPDATDQELLDTAEAMANAVPAKPTVEVEKPQTRKPRDPFGSMDKDALLDAITSMEDDFGKFQGEELATALDARRKAQEASPNWAETDDVPELLVYARNLKAQYDTIKG